MNHERGAALQREAWAECLGGSWMATGWRAGRTDGKAPVTCVESKMRCVEAVWAGLCPLHTSDSHNMAQVPETGL